ncbi:DUF3413 domain-containing protein [Thalassotalea psychrophila]|uniref:DUF3413 domain-containing protein n=1 Tax=Thalassotalea psychrophila TaxID=3065647 RepID=A0ABY9TU99_9GAMM|nr:DUF3413 domain-containing protein [Colwelliaceae bacterium SQ149]
MNNFQTNNVKSWLNRYLIVNFIITLFIALRYLAPHPYPDSVISTIFLFTYSVAHLGLLALLLTGLLHLLARIIKHYVAIRFIAIILVSLALSLLLADTFVYQQYRFHFNGIVFELMVEGGTEIFSFSWQLWTLIGLIILAFFAAQIFLSEMLRNKFVRTQFSLKTPLKVWLVFLLLGHGIHTWADAKFEKNITQQARYLPISFPLTAKGFMAKFGVVNIEAQKQQALLKQKKVKSAINYPLSAMQCEPVEQQKNILMITLDSWRSDMMDAKMTPTIQSIADKGTHFKQHYSGSNNTRHGMFSLFYAIPGHYWQPILDTQNSPVLMDVIKEQSYDIGIFASAKLTSPEFDQTLFSNVENLRTHSKGDKPFERDMDITKDFIQWHKNKSNTKPFFAFMLYDAAHGFSIPKDFERKYTPSLDEINYMALNDDYDSGPFLNLYKNSINFIDLQIQQVIEQLGDDINNTIIIITGDHGKEFNDSKKGFWGHNSNYSRYQTQVPLIIHWPDAPKSFYQSQTSHYDIAPTLLTDALGCSNNSNEYSSGQSLFTKQQHSWLIFGRDGYYAIKDNQQLNELDRLGNFTIFDDDYQEVGDGKLDMKVVLEAMEELRRFNN